MSRFLDQSVMPGEKIVRIGEFHIVYTITSFVILGVLTACGAVLQMLLVKLNLGGAVPAGTLTEASRLPLFIGAGIGLLIFTWRWLVKATTEIVLTDKRFLFKRGVFSVRTEKMAVREVNYCEIRQSLLGNLLDYGRIYVYTMTLDDNNILLPEISKPHIFTSLIEQVKKGGMAADMNAMVNAQAAAMRGAYHDKQQQDQE